VREDLVNLAMKAGRQVPPGDDLAGEGLDLVASPTREAPGHQFTRALFGVRPFQVRSVNPARDVRPLAGIGEVVSARDAGQGLHGPGFDAPAIEERVKEVFPHVATPERSVAIRGDHAAGVFASEGLDSRPDVVCGLQLHFASITDRPTPGFD
jgi:hypothetical protein